jgi:hypothetical protein
MRGAWRLTAAALPGAALAVAACLGWEPTVRDLPNYFVPLRQRTAEVLMGTRGPFWNPDVGCGEPFFANPQSGLLYPPAWLATVLPPARAVGVEAGLHLAILGVGCALLARRLGAGAWLEIAAGWGVVAAGPVLDSVGVLNNLDTLAWMPWVWGAVLGGSLAGTASFLALSFLAAEPQLAVVAAAAAVALAPSRRTLLSLLLASGLVAVLALPFAVWVHGGDRGPSREVNEVAAGSVRPAELAALAFPGAKLPPRPDRFVTDLAVPLWALVLGVAALFSKKRAVRVLAASGWALLAAGVVAGVRGPDVIWAALTGGLVRYPGRLVFPAVVALVPAAAAAVGERRRPLWSAAAVTVLALGGGALSGAGTLATAVQGLTAGGAFAGPATAVAAVLGSAALLPAHANVLALRSGGERQPAACLSAQRDGGTRIYAVQPSWDQLGWVAGNRERGTSLGWGYSALRDGRRTVRTFAPLQSVRLTAHLDEADRGPAARWWLDALGARRIVAQHPVAGFPVVCEELGLTVLDNPGAWPEVTVVRSVPRPGEALDPHGDVLTSSGGDDRRRWRVRAGAGGGVLLWLETPDDGWRVRVDGRPAEGVSGPGIVHGVAVPAGEHEVTARYRPPAFVAGAVISLVSLGLLGGAAWRRF